VMPSTLTEGRTAAIITSIVLLVVASQEEAIFKGSSL